MPVISCFLSGRMTRRAGGLLLVFMLLASCGGGDGDSDNVVLSTTTGRSQLYISGNNSDALLVYADANSVAGNTAASRTVSNVATTLSGPRGIAVDMARNQIYVANAADNSILVFNKARTMTGEIAPFRKISGGSLHGPAGLFIDAINDRLYVTNNGSDSVLIYDSASTATIPTRALIGNTTELSAPTGIYVDTTRNLLYVANGSNQILVFNNAAITSGTIDIGPLRRISIASSSAGVFVDVMADRLYVANTGANSIFIFDGASTATGSASHRVISASLNEPRDIFIDTGTDRLYVANTIADSVLVFNNVSTTNNPLAPARTLNLPANTDPWGISVDVTPIVIGSAANRDGYVLNDGSGVNTDPAGGGPKTGDLEEFLVTPLIARQFYSFELTGIPSTVSVRSAALRLYQANVQGSPYGIGNLGSVIVDHVNYDTLDGADYNAAALTSNIGTLSTDALQEYKTLNVTTNVASDIQFHRLRSQYRLRFSVENSANFQNDYAQFTDAEDTCCVANRPPQLVITISP